MNYLELIRKLYSLPADQKFGFDEKLLKQTEERLGVTLPAVLKSYYLFLGKNEAVNESFNQLLSPDKIDFVDDAYLIFFEENQSVVLWGIKKSDLSLENPKVYATYDQERVEWFLDSETVENFLLSMALWNGVLGGLKHTALIDAQDKLSLNIIEAVEQGWKELTGLTNQMLRFFTNDYSEVLIFTTDHDKSVNGLYFGTNDQKKYHETIEKLNLEWDYRSDLDV
jgi:hypothetical protein